MATKKIQRDASAQDLDQMKNLFGGSTVRQVIQDEQVEQKITTVSNEKPVAPIQTVAISSNNTASNTSNVIADDRKEVSDTTVGIRMTQKKKRELKAYFIQKGMTLSEGVMAAYELMKDMEKANQISFVDGQVLKN